MNISSVIKISHVMHISILDKPSSPRNLIADNITAESVDLKWQESEDDGGSPVTTYIVEKRDMSRKTWQEVLKTADLSCTASKLVVNSQYTFRVAAENVNGRSDYVEILMPITAKNQFSKKV